MFKVVKTRALMGKLTALYLAFVVGGASAMMLPQQEMSDEAIEKRIQAIGKVRLAGAEAQTASAGSGEPRSGQAVYDRFCTACHTSGALGAPKINVAGDWEPRLAQGMETVLKHAIEGYNAMPPKGTCGDCSDDEIQAAIDYMIAEI